MRQLKGNLFRLRILRLVHHLFNIGDPIPVKYIVIAVNIQTILCPRHTDIEPPSIRIAAQNGMIEKQPHTFKFSAFRTM